MITLKFCKKGGMVFVSHIDLLRHMTRTLRRTDLPVAYSQGFNPHMIINMGITLPLGVRSDAEYMTVDVDCDAHTFLSRYNQCAPSNLGGLVAWRVDKNPNLAGTVVAADYRMGVYCGPQAEAVADVVNRPTYCIAYPTKKDAEATKDIAPLLNALRVQEDCIWVCMAAGNTTVKPQFLQDALAAEFGLHFGLGDCVRTRQYVRQEGVLCDVDDYLSRIATEQAYV